jgi:hypothetical protein
LGMPFLGLPFLGMPFLGLPFLGLPFLGMPFLGLPFLGLPFLGLPFLGLPFLGLTRAQGDRAGGTLLHNQRVQSHGPRFSPSNLTWEGRAWPGSDSEPMRLVTARLEYALTAAIGGRSGVYTTVRRRERATALRRVERPRHVLRRSQTLNGKSARKYTLDPGRRTTKAPLYPAMYSVWRLVEDDATRATDAGEFAQHREVLKVVRPAGRRLCSSRSARPFFVRRASSIGAKSADALEEICSPA